MDFNYLKLVDPILDGTRAERGSKYFINAREPQDSAWDLRVTDCTRNFGIRGCRAISLLARTKFRLFSSTVLRRLELTMHVYRKLRCGRCCEQRVGLCSVATFQISSAQSRRLIEEAKTRINKRLNSKFK